ncbi:transporter [Geotalea uraniireducens]|uniref:Transporter n=1 Tax=Geotalea uraniireducens TaxID=351604 RepID=A0ABM8EHM5_9BACT|nr:sodium:alanine symporter family protein [Geotalea uraniireducens]BDV41911.1 transporter [Geotalea uraniireducens]
MAQLNSFLAAASSFVWGIPLLVLLVGTGILLTVRLRGIQVTMLPHALRETFVKPRSDEAGDVSHFEALMIALAATIGTGNIIGVATAISVGGPGALFWMWITAAFGMATKYSEGVLAVKYRVTDANGEMAGGPMYYLERGLGKKWLGVLFALFGAIAAFGIGNVVQANAVAGNLRETFGVAPWITGVVLAICTALVILGGVKNIGQVTGWMVPVMAVVYVCGCLAILGRYAGEVPAALALVFHDAFTGSAATGGFVGATLMLAIQKGVSRGVFSNESGLGSAPIAAAAAKTGEPCEQALVSMTGTFIDTIIVCTMTGLVLIVTGAWNSGAEVSALTKSAFDTGLPGNSGGYIVSFGIVFFAYSTILGWAYYGEKCMEYLLGVKALLPYRLVFSLFVAVGATTKLEVVWNFSDVMNGLMAVPNLIGLLGLSGVIVEETNRFLAKRKAAVEAA